MKSPAAMCFQSRENENATAPRDAARRFHRAAGDARVRRRCRSLTSSSSISPTVHLVHLRAQWQSVSPRPGNRRRLARFGICTPRVARFRLPCGQPLRAAHARFSLPCGHRFRTPASIAPLETTFECPPPPRVSLTSCQSAPRVVRRPRGKRNTARCASRPSRKQGSPTSHTSETVHSEARGRRCDRTACPAARASCWAFWGRGWGSTSRGRTCC